MYVFRHIHWYHRTFQLNQLLSKFAAGIGWPTWCHTSALPSSKYNRLPWTMHAFCRKNNADCTVIIATYSIVVVNNGQTYAGSMNIMHLIDWCRLLEWCWLLQWRAYAAVLLANESRRCNIVQTLKYKPCNAQERWACVLDHACKAFWVRFSGLVDYDQEQHGTTARDRKSGPGNGPERWPRKCHQRCGHAQCVTTPCVTLSRPILRPIIGSRGCALFSTGGHHAL